MIWQRENNMNKSGVMCVSVFVLSLSGCSMSHNVDMAKSKIPLFHSELNSGKYEVIYTEASQELRNADSEDNFVAFLSAVNRKLGPFESSTSETWKMNYNTSGTFVSVSENSNFEHGKATENFVYRIKDGTALLVGYHINSNALIMR